MQGQRTMTPAVGATAVGCAVAVLVFLIALIIAPRATIALVHAITSGLGQLAYDIAHGVATLLRTWGTPSR